MRIRKDRSGGISLFRSVNEFTNVRLETAVKISIWAFFIGFLGSPQMIAGTSGGGSNSNLAYAQWSSTWGASSSSFGGSSSVILPTWPPIIIEPEPEPDPPDCSDELAALEEAEDRYQDLLEEAEELASDLQRLAESVDRLIRQAQEERNKYGMTPERMMEIQYTIDRAREAWARGQERLSELEGKLDQAAQDVQDAQDAYDDCMGERDSGSGSSSSRWV